LRWGPIALKELAFECGKYPQSEGLFWASLKEMLELRREQRERTDVQCLRKGVNTQS